MDGTVATEVAKGIDAAGQLIIGAPIFALAILMILGSGRRYVVFLNLGDIFWTLGMFIFPIVGAFAAALLADALQMQPKLEFSNIIDNPLFWGVMTLIGLGFLKSFWRTFIVSIALNGLFMGLLIAVCKLIASVFLVVAFIPCWLFAVEGGRRPNSYQTNWLVVLVFGIFFWMIRKMINAQNVLERREELELEAQQKSQRLGGTAEGQIEAIAN